MVKKRGTVFGTQDRLGLGNEKSVYHWRPKYKQTKSHTGNENNGSQRQKIFLINFFLIVVRK